MAWTHGRCDAVVGKVGKREHICGRKAVVCSKRTIFVPSEGNMPYHLNYCEQHKNRAYTVDLPCLHVEEVVSL